MKIRAISNFKNKLIGEQRVVCLMPHFADHLLTLGIKPVGLVTEGNGSFIDYLNNDLEGVLGVGRSKELDLEAIIEAKPTLILGEAKKHLPYYKELTTIAPTILFKDMSQDWQEIFLYVANAIGQEENANVELENFNQEVSKYKEQIKVEHRKQIVFLNVWKDFGFQVYSPQSSIGKLIYEGLDFETPNLPFIDEKYSKHKYMFPTPISDLEIVNASTYCVLGTHAKKDVWNNVLQNKEWLTFTSSNDRKVIEIKDLKDGNEGKGIIFYQKFLTEFMDQINKKETIKQ